MQLQESRCDRVKYSDGDREEVEVVELQRLVARANTSKAEFKTTVDEMKEVPTPPAARRRPRLAAAAFHYHAALRK